MNRPPLLMHFRIRNEEHNFGLWLPLFLLLPLALVIGLILSPLILIGIIVLWPSGWGKLALRVLWAAWGLYCATRGLKVDVHHQRDTVQIAFV